MLPENIKIFIDSTPTTIFTHIFTFEKKQEIIYFDMENKLNYN